ncbi:MAG: nuclear transport factor 2 family protein [Steroidobacteraceae bacterium]
MNVSAPLPDTPHAQVAAADEARLKAMEQMDLPTLERIFADELVYVHSTGKHEGKQTYLASLGSGHIEYRRLKRDAMTVTVIDDTATVVSNVEIDLRVDGDDKALSAKSLGVWLRRDNRWVLIAISMTRMTQHSH